MESSSSLSKIIKKSPKSSSSSSSFVLTTLIPVAFLLLLSPLLFSHRHSPPPPPPPPPLTVRPPSPPHPFIKNTCNNTLYPSICFHTLSSIPINNHNNNNHTKLRHLLQFSIHKTINRVTKSRSRMSTLTNSKLEENNWVENCIELLDQTMYELQESIKPFYPPYNDPPPYATIKTLLSAAMTNENTCIEGFEDHTQTRLGRYFQKSLTPIMRMISNCLAIINYIETMQGPTDAQTRLLSKAKGLYHDHDLDHHLPSWMTAADRRLMQIPPRIISPTVVVAMDGSGNFTTISAAVATAPNRSPVRYVIQIKAGIYNENLVIPRQKSNIMLVGEGMNSTIITGDRNFVDGYTTFTSLCSCCWE